MTTNTYEKIAIGIFMLLICTTIVFALPNGYWLEIAYSGDVGCTGNSHVMCSENGTSYNPATGLIPYNEETVDETNWFCAISTVGTYGFKFYNVGSLHELKDQKFYIEAYSESPNSIMYDNALSKHYDENCNGDELFLKDGSGALDLSKYIENNIEYDVIYDQANIDGFDIVAGLGTSIYGTVTDENTGMPIVGANVTLYFKNYMGTFIPYKSFITDSNGEYDSLEHPRDITTSYVSEGTTYTRTFLNVLRIPITTYIVVVNHPQYEDYIIDVPIAVSNPYRLDIGATPYGLCEDDCTYEGSNLCRKECDGKNGCEFYRFDWDNTYNISVKVDLAPKDTIFGFMYDGANPSYYGKNYSMTTCEGVATEVDSSGNASASGITCPAGQDAWKTEKIVNYKGKLVIMEVLYCR